MYVYTLVYSLTDKYERELIYLIEAYYQDTSYYIWSKVAADTLPLFISPENTCVNQGFKVAMLYVNLRYNTGPQ